MCHVLTVYSTIRGFCGDVLSVVIRAASNKRIKKEQKRSWKFMYGWNISLETDKLDKSIAVISSPLVEADGLTIT